MNDKTKLYDHSGKPISQPDHRNDSEVSPGIQALIETRINTGLDNLRESNRHDLIELARDHARQWRRVAWISIALNVVFLFIAPHQIITWVERQIDEKLTVPMLRESADRLITEKMGNYVTDQLEPLNKQASELKSTIDLMATEIRQKQSSLEEGQEQLQGQLHIQELAIASKAGSRKAYSELLRMVNTESERSDLLTASLKEIELFYDTDRHQLLFPKLVNAETMKDPGFAVDEIVHVLRTTPDHAEGAINTLAERKQKATIGELCKVVLSTEELRVAARATRAIQIITDERIAPLDFEKVKVWWGENRDRKEFLGDYDGYCEVVSKMRGTTVRMSQLDDLVMSLSKTIDSDSSALHSMCLKAAFMLMSNKVDDARELLEIVKKEQPDYYWYHVWAAALKIKEEDFNTAIDSLNAALKRSPASNVVKTVMFWKIFEPIINDSRVNWPDNKKTNEPPAQEGG